MQSRQEGDVQRHSRTLFLVFSAGLNEHQNCPQPLYKPGPRRIQSARVGEAAWELSTVK
jgi:hypothetical protein